MDDFEAAGGRFEIADDVAGDGPLRLIGPSAFPQLSLTLTGHRLKAEIVSQEPGFDGPLNSLLGGTDLAPMVEALSKLLSPIADFAAGPPERLTGPSGLSVSVVTGRPSVDGRVTDQVEAIVDDVAHLPLEAFLRLVVEVAERRSPAPMFLSGRSFRVTRSASPGVRPESGFDQLGGLDDVVAQLREVADSFNHAEVMARWGARRPQGILMWGPPGTGKTTLAKALAVEIGGTLKEIRTPDILDQWMGSSERNIKKIFTEARGYRDPTVLLFDEFDSIIGYAGAVRGAADQAINSVAGIFKQEMNTLIDENPNVIVVATTNFPSRVDDSLIRSGRFDVKISVPLPDSPARAAILATMISSLSARHDREGFRLFADDLSVVGLAGAAGGLSGADLKEVLRRAQMSKAMAEARGSSTGPITQADLLAIIAGFTPPA